MRNGAPDGRVLNRNLPRWYREQDLETASPRAPFVRHRHRLSSNEAPTGEP